MKKKSYFQKLYKFDEISKTFLIEVSLDNYDDVYDDWDPSPFRRRDIENEFNDFIVNSSEDIPLKHNISIVLYMPTAQKNPQKEKALLSAYRNYYHYTIERLKKAKANLQRKNISYLLFSILLLGIGYFFVSNERNVLLNVIHEGILIGGWVFLWEFFTNTFITARELNNEYLIYKRLYQADVKFIYYEK